MTTRSIFLLLLSGLFTLTTHAQAPQIAENLLKNSDAVTRLMSLDFVYNSPTSATLRVIEQITILNNSATGKGNFECYVSPTISLKSFSGTLSDAQGRTIRKLKRGDLKYSEYSAGNLAIDAATYYMEVYSPSYPYTVRYESEVVLKDGILGFPSFMPLTTTGTSLEKGVYTISVPAGMEFGYKCLNIGEPEKSTSNGRDIYRWTLENIPAMKSEPASPPALDKLPVVLSAPYEFQYEKTTGSMRDWASYGVWQCELLEGRDVLPEALRAEVHRLTDHLATPREKVQALYKYMGETTRYVSIQLGIGGQQPAPAAEVYKTKFGDCKALSNYLLAMLKECGIASEYVIIHTARKKMYPDFASPNQANHAILSVPLEGETLWLECTNTDVPFGYVHDDIAGHDAIVFRDGKGEFVTLPQYADSLNRLVQEVVITLKDDGSGEGRVTERYEVSQYEQVMGFSKKDEKKRTDYLLSDLKVPMIRVDNISFEEQKDALPWMQIAYDISSPKYFNITGNRCFLPQTPFSNSKLYRDKERQYDIHYAEGYLDITTVKIDLPETLQVETLPAPCHVTAPFGSYSLLAIAGKGSIVIIHTTSIKAGTYSREMFKEYQDFINGRARAFSANLVLKKQ
ncbi:transglutaminase family protein [uncultured Alistipes sp.]|jgi:Transglutaminase-like enzymes, putative cysteine proteases|uniref:transglutaminase-like domain-containing protein n=1 Tax=uncultured Alistipes sp. TaxID=538949 RepID=UPI0025E2F798|nr:transglutaminase family protein [uncultured Alistipes sp.]